MSTLVDEIVAVPHSAVDGFTVHPNLVDWGYRRAAVDKLGTVID